MKLAVILTIIFPHICFASPFDLANDQYEEEVIEEPEEIKKVNVESNETSEEKNAIFQSTNKAEIVAVNIKNGNKYQNKVNVGDNVKIERLNLEIKSCLIEKDLFYKRISLAEVELNREEVIISNDTNLRNIVRGDILLLVNCL